MSIPHNPLLPTSAVAGAAAAVFSATPGPITAGPELHAPLYDSSGLTYAGIEETMGAVMAKEEDTAPYQPSVEDVLAVKEAFLQRSPLPLEVVDAIIDQAEYWPRTVSQMKGVIHVRGSSPQENVLILRSLPVGFRDDRQRQDFSHYPSHQPLPKAPLHEDAEATKRLIAQWVDACEPRSRACQKIVFRLKSHDQGWGGSHRGTYQSSYTWFDVGLERVCVSRRPPYVPPLGGRDGGELPEEPDPAAEATIADMEEFPQLRHPSSSDIDDDTMLTLMSLKPKAILDEEAQGVSRYKFDHALLADEMCLQKNLTATKTTQTQVITWTGTDCIHPDSAAADDLKHAGRGKNTLNGEFVRSLRPGDVITLWAKARFPGWSNIVEQASIEVYWAV